jgi:hypothetical protein
MSKISKIEKSRFRSTSSVLLFLTCAILLGPKENQAICDDLKIVRPIPITPETEPVRITVRIVDSFIPLLSNDLPFTSFFLTVLTGHGVLAPLDSYELAISVHLMKQLIDRISIRPFRRGHDLGNVQPVITCG